ncbi:MAG: hypothetical protein U9O94_06055 [Nanoarchaeota archaeon]|nr:hypothetical protein [Nanoarchaeota archaeon]
MSEYRATVSIHYPKTEAISSLNYNSKNRKFRETVTVSDITILSFTKNLTDVNTPNDVLSLMVTKNLVDKVTTVDNLSITIRGTTIIVIVPTSLLNGSPLNTRTLN